MGKSPAISKPPVKKPRCPPVKKKHKKPPAAKAGVKPISTTFTVRDVPVSMLIPYARNARKIPDSAVTKVAASIKEFGFRVPITITDENVIVAGHTRLMAAKKLKMQTVPVHVLSGLTPQQIKAYRIADNRTAEETEWDSELLALELQELKTLGVDLTITGLDHVEIEGALQAFTPAEEDQQGQLDKRESHEHECPNCGHVWED